MTKLKIWQLTGAFLDFFCKLLLAHWRALLILFVGVYLPLQIFGLLAVVIWENAGGFPWDTPILLTIHSYARPQLDAFAIKLTKLASFSIMFPVVMTLALVLLYLKKWRSLAFWLTTILGAKLINRTAKELMHRVRPNLWDSPSPEFDYAFPSGHAMISMAVVAALVILTWGSSWRWLIAVVGSVFVVVIAWTRLYLGVHFPSDILAGWMVSLAWAIGVSLLLKPSLSRAIATNNEQSLNETSLLPEESLSGERST